MKPNRTRNRPRILGWIKMRAAAGKMLGASALLFLLSLGMGLALAGEELNVLLEKAQERLRTASSFHVEATLTNEALSAKVTGDIAGDDFNLVVKLESGVTGIRCVRNKYWLTNDSGKTWKKTEPDRGIFDLIRKPGNSILAPDQSRLVALPPERQPKNESRIIQVRPIPEPDNLDVDHLPSYSIDTMTDGRACVMQYIGPIIWAETVLFMDVRYSKIDEIPKITAPEHIVADPP